MPKTNVKRASIGPLTVSYSFARVRVKVNSGNSVESFLLARAPQANTIYTWSLLYQYIVAIYSKLARNDCQMLSSRILRRFTKICFISIIFIPKKYLLYLFKNDVNFIGTWINLAQKQSNSSPWVTLCVLPENNIHLRT